MQLRKPPLPALTVKLSKYNVDDVALGVCKTGAEEAGVTEVRTSLSEKKFELWREITKTFFLISWFSLLLLQLLRHLFYRHLKLHRQRYILIVCRLMLVMVVFFIAFRWIHLSTPL